MKKLLTTNYSLQTTRGLASLPAIILFGGLLVEIGIAGALLVFYLNNSLYGTRLANEALVIAHAGIDDGLLQIIRDKSCPNATCSASYTLSSGNGLATVSLCKDSCSGLNTTQITSTGRVLTRRHKLIAVVSIDQTTGLVTLTSITDADL